MRKFKVEDSVTLDQFEEFGFVDDIGGQDIKTINKSEDGYYEICKIINDLIYIQIHDVEKMLGYREVIVTVVQPSKTKGFVDTIGELTHNDNNKNYVRRYLKDIMEAGLVKEVEE